MMKRARIYWTIASIFSTCESSSRNKEMLLYFATTTTRKKIIIISMGLFVVFFFPFGNDTASEYGHIYFEKKNTTH
jgi:hypothetical protein